MPKISKENSKISRDRGRPELAGLLDKIQPVEFSPDEGLHMLVYGRSGSGKTTFWSTFPAPILALVASGGHRSGELRSVATERNKERIKVLNLSSPDEVLEVAEYQKETGKFKTVVLDNVGGFQDMVLADILNIDTVPETKTWGMATKQDYGAAVDQCKRTFRALSDLSCHTVLVAHEREFNSDTEAIEEGLQPFVGADAMPSLSGWLHKTFDYIVHMYIRDRMILKKTKIAGKTNTREVASGEKEHVLRCTKHNVYLTKFRIPKEYLQAHPLEDIVDPSFDKLSAMLEGKPTAEK